MNQATQAAPTHKVVFRKDLVGKIRRYINRIEILTVVIVKEYVMRVAWSD